MPSRAVRLGLKALMVIYSADRVQDSNAVWPPRVAVVLPALATSSLDAPHHARAHL